MVPVATVITCTHFSDAEERLATPAVGVLLSLLLFIFRPGYDSSVQVATSGDTSELPESRNKTLSATVSEQI